MTQSVAVASKTALIRGTDSAEAALSTIERLEQLAARHRLNADHAGSIWIWDARLQMAEDLERVLMSLALNSLSTAARRKFDQVR
jgi:hypothetical protein